MDREELAQQTEQLMAEYNKDASEYDGITPIIGRQYSQRMALLLEHWVAGWRNVPSQGRHAAKKHNAGRCEACSVSHSVPEALRLNGDEPQYGNMIRRTEGQEDPLVQEPKK
jgi:hypothetical protein